MITKIFAFVMSTAEGTALGGIAAPVCCCRSTGGAFESRNCPRGRYADRS